MKSIKEQHFVSVKGSRLSLKSKNISFLIKRFWSNWLVRLDNYIVLLFKRFDFRDKEGLDISFDCLNDFDFPDKERLDIAFDYLNDFDFPDKRKLLKFSSRSKSQFWDTDDVKTKRENYNLIWPILTGHQYPLRKCCHGNKLVYVSRSQLSRWFNQDVTWPICYRLRVLAIICKRQSVFFLTIDSLANGLAQKPFVVTLMSKYMVMKVLW